MIDIEIQGLKKYRISNYVLDFIDKKYEKLCKSHPSLRRIDGKFNRFYQRISSSKAIDCQRCGVKFTWNKMRNVCECCNKFVCRNCVSPFSEEVNEDFSIKICDECWEPCTTGIRSVIIVRSNHVGGHNTIRTLGNLSTSEWRNICDAETEIKYNAYKMGANAVLSYRYKKFRSSEETDTGGTYYFSTFSGYGMAAVVEPRRRNEK